MPPKRYGTPLPGSAAGWAGVVKHLKRTVALVLYYAVAQRLPDYSFPKGNAFRTVRALACKSFFGSTGEWINVEGGVFVGDGRDVHLGDGSSIGHGSRMYGAQVGRDVMIGPECVFLKENHAFGDISRPIRAQGYTGVTPPVIEDEAWIGERAIILPGRTVGRGAIVGAGSVVTRNVAPYSIVAGNPARVIGHRTAITPSR